LCSAGLLLPTGVAFTACDARPNTNDGQKIAARMKEISSKDPLFGESHIREDGRHIHDMYLFQVKTPAESKGAVGFLQAGGNDSGEGRIPSAGRRQLPDGEEVSRFHGYPLLRASAVVV